MLVLISIIFLIFLILLKYRREGYNNNDYYHICSDLKLGNCNSNNSCNNPDECQIELKPRGDGATLIEKNGKMENISKRSEVAEHIHNLCTGDYYPGLDKYQDIVNKVCYQNKKCKNALIGKTPKKSDVLCLTRDEFPKYNIISHKKKLCQNNKDIKDELKFTTFDAALRSCYNSDTCKSIGKYRLTDRNSRYSRGIKYYTTSNGVNTSSNLNKFKDREIFRCNTNEHPPRCPKCRGFKKEGSWDPSCNKTTSMCCPREGTYYDNTGESKIHMGCFAIPKPQDRRRVGEHWKHYNIVER